MDIDRRQPGLDRIAGSDLRLDQISYGTYFGEGPVWDRRKQRFLWTAANSRVRAFMILAQTPARGTNEAIVASSVRTEVVRQVAPRRSRSQDPEDALEDTTVVHPWHAARLVRQHRLMADHSSSLSS